MEFREDDDPWWRKNLRGMLIDFYKDVRRDKLYEKEETTSLKEFYEYIDKWIDKHFAGSSKEKE